MRRLCALLLCLILLVAGCTAAPPPSFPAGEEVKTALEPVQRAAPALPIVSTLAVCGDCMSHKPQIADSLNKETGEYSYYHMFAAAAPYVTAADYGLVNLEVPLAGGARRALEELAKAGIFSGVLLMPVLPYVEDSAENVLSVVDSAARAGARFVYAAFGVTMRDGQRDYFLDSLDRAFPGMGERYRKRYGSHYYCSSPKAKELWELFSSRCRELGLLYEMKHIISAAKRPYGDTQLTFFDM